MAQEDPRGIAINEPKGLTYFAKVSNAYLEKHCNGMDAVRRAERE